MAGSEPSESPSPPTGLLRAPHVHQALAQGVARAVLASAVGRSGTQASAASTLGVARAYLNGILNGHRRISPTFVDRLPALGVSANTIAVLRQLLVVRPALRCEPPTHPDEALHTIRQAYELQFGHPEPDDPPSSLALSDIPEAAGHIATGLPHSHPQRAHLQVQALLLRSYAQALLGNFADALWCALCAERLVRETHWGNDRNMALAQTAVAQSQPYLALGLRAHHALAVGTVLDAAGQLHPKAASGLAIAGQRGRLGGLLQQRRPQRAEIRDCLRKIEDHVACGHCRTGDGELELLLSYPLAMQAAIARDNRLNLRWAESLCTRGREIVDRAPGAFGVVPQLIFLEAEAGVMKAIGDRGGQRKALVEMRHIAEAHALNRPLERAEALLAAW